MAEASVDKRRPGESRGESQNRALSRANEWYPSMSSPWSSLSMNPFAMMRRMSEEMDRMFSGSTGLTGDGSTWVPTVEVTERDNNLVVRADLPGINQNDVKVEVTPEGLVIQGERKREHEERDRSGYRSERIYGSFYRMIPLPEGANIDAAKAEFKDGVLEVTVPIPEEQRRRRQIPISAGSSERKPASGEPGASRQQEATRTR